MTKQEAIQWIQLDIDMAKFDPTTGEDAYLNDDAKSVIEAQEMAISALKAQMDGDVVSRNAIIKKLNAMDRYKADELVLCDTDEKFPKNEVFIVDDVYEEIVEQLPSAQPEPLQVARDIATIIENEQDMRVILKNAQNDIIHCEDCRFRHKSPDWKHRQSFGESIWYCEKNRGLNFAEAVELDDYCSSAKRRING